MKQRIAVGMSGGVDSSVTAWLLREQGFEVVGVTLFLRDHATRCVGLEDTERAAAVAEKMGIEHHVVDARNAFEKRIIEPFAQEYAVGRTPSPCVSCNPLIKFGLMLDYVLEQRCDGLATGHYIRNVKGADGLFHLFRGEDRSKDQSYFLHRLTQGVLARTYFPLGDMVKAEVQDMAVEHGMVFPGQSESQDLCFTDERGYVPFVENYFPGLPGAGDFVDETGRVVGRHKGFFRYTIGQRKGIGIPGEEAYYVKGIRASDNVVIIGPKQTVFSESCIADHVNWIAGVPPVHFGDLSVQVRYRSAPVAAELEELKSNCWQFHFSEKQFAVTPGQAVAIYRGDEILGGGWIV